MNPEINDSSCWREFEKTDVSHSAAHYLMTIDSLRREFGYARCTDVAERLEVTRGAASTAVAHLKKRDLVTEDPRKFLLLTAAGQRVVKQIARNYGILARFFEEVLTVSREVAQADACKMEHLVSFETGRRMLRLMEYVLADATRAATVRDAVSSLRQTKKEAGGSVGGELFPAHSHEEQRAARKLSLVEIAAGDTGTVVDVKGNKTLHDRLKALGIRCGTKITKVSDSFAHGPVVIQHGQTQTALGSGICAKILVEIPK